MSELSTTFDAIYARLIQFKASTLQAQLRVLVTEPGREPRLALDARTPHDPASLAKLMTLYTDLADTRPAPESVRITDHALLHGNLTFNALKKNDVLLLETARAAMAVASDNIAAGAIAIARGEGRTDADRHRHFVKAMNAHAARLGMADTHFANASGMPLMPSRDKTLRLATTTAQDMATLITALYRDFPDEAKRYLEQDSVTYKTYTLQPNHRLNREDAVGSLIEEDVTVGGKTGFTNRARNNIAAMVRDSDGNQLVVIVLGSNPLPLAKAVQLSPELAKPEARIRNKDGSLSDLVRGAYIRDIWVQDIVREWRAETHRTAATVCMQREVPLVLPGSFAYAIGEAAPLPLLGPLNIDEILVPLATPKTALTIPRCPGVTP